MNAASRWRLSLSRLLAEHYAALPQVATVFVGGSTARGQADRFSDLELCVAWSSPPSEADRLRVIHLIAILATNV